MKENILVSAIALLLIISGVFVLVEPIEGKEKNGFQPVQKIQDWHDLDEVREDLSGDYILIDDLDEDTDGHEELVADGEGWNPIGDKWDEDPFTGSFDGQGYTISGLYIGGDHQTVGLFGTVGGEEMEDSAEIKNVGLINSTIESYISEEWQVSGSLVGHLYESEVRESFTSDVDISAVVEDEGRADVGGLIGHQTRAEIQNSYSTGEAGGFSGNTTVGGLVGTSCTDGYFNNTYSTVNITGGTISGGLVGYEAYSNDTVFINSYWNSETSGLGHGVGDGLEEGVYGRITEDMVYPYTENTYVDWDFEGVWRSTLWNQDQENNEGYPALEWQEPPEYTLDVMVEGQGSVDVDPDRSVYEFGTEVNLTAVSEEDWEFVRWTGDHDSEEAETTIIMDEDKEITAHFEEKPFFKIEITGYEEEVVENDTVTVEFTVTNKGGLQGTQDIIFTVNDEEIDRKENVTISEGDHRFIEFTWEAEEEGDHELEIASEDDQDSVRVTVEEEVIFHELIINIEGNGAVEVDGVEVEDGRTGKFEEGTNLTLEAIIEKGWAFEEWTGDVNDTDTTIDITVDSDKEITAHFEEKDDNEEIPGFTTMLFVLTSVLVVAIYKRKRP